MNETTTNEPHELTTAERVALLETLGITFHVEYVKPARAAPFVNRLSDEPGAPEMSMFLYRVTLGNARGRTYSTEYSMGLGHVEYAKSRDGESDRVGRAVALEKLWRAQPTTFPAVRATRTLPTLLDVLCSLVIDAQYAANARNFDDFCDELGYNNDSRKAESIYRACQDTHTELSRLFTRDELATITRATDGY